MPLPDLTPEEYAEIVRLVRSAIDGERYVLSPRVKRLKSTLVKLDPAPSATVTPYPAPRPPHAERPLPRALSLAARWPRSHSARGSGPLAARDSREHPSAAPKFLVDHRVLVQPLAGTKKGQAALGNGRNVEILRPFAGKMIELVGFFREPSLHAGRRRVGD